MRFLTILALLTMFGCASEKPEALTSVEDDNSVFIVGTLADANDPFGMAAAPVITQATVVRISTLRALQKQRIDVDMAKSLQLCADNAINDVNVAQASKSMAAITTAGTNAQTCKLRLDRAKEQSK